MPPPPGSASARPLLVLLAAAALVVTANISTPGLPALDDCHYARKGVEMAREGRFATVTWNGEITTQHPPLQFAILSLSFRLIGESDFAARLPSVLMALCVLLIVFRIGSVLLSAEAALTGVALLLVSPYFMNNARRCMLDMPLAFWSALCLLIWLEGERRPRLHLLLAIPLGAAVLTKSILGLLPLVVILAVSAFAPAARRWIRNPWAWLGLSLGLCAGPAWLLQQSMSHGGHVLATHVKDELLRRSVAPLPWVQRLSDYPKVLIESYQPVAILALLGAVLLARRWLVTREGLAIVVPVWAFLPVVAYSIPSAHSPRYLFPLFAPLALCAGYFLVETLPRIARWISRGLVPVAAVVLAVLFWASPGLLEKRGTATIKREGPAITKRVEAGESIAYLGDNYWSLANATLYYAERAIDRPAVSAGEAVQRAATRPSRLLLVDRTRWHEIAAVAPDAKVLVEESTWLLAEMALPAASPPGQWAEQTVTAQPRR